MQTEEYSKIGGLLETTSQDNMHLVFGESSYGAAVTIDLIHALIHRGWAFSHDEIHSSIGVNSGFDHLIYVTSFHGDVHLAIPYVANEQGTVEMLMYEGVQVSSLGALHPSRNLNRYHPDSSYASVYDGPVVTSLGTLIGDRGIPSGGNKTSAEAVYTDERVLRQNTYYLIRAINRANQASDISLGLRWVELNAH